jgi:hypothetical protein
MFHFCRDEILGTTMEDFHKFADALAVVRDQGRVVAVTSSDKLQQGQAERPGFFNEVKRVV